MEAYLTWPAFGFLAIFLGALLMIIAVNLRWRGKLSGGKPAMAVALVIGILALFGLGGFILVGIL